MLLLQGVRVSGPVGVETRRARALTVPGCTWSVDRAADRVIALGDMKVKPAVPGTVIRYPGDPKRRLPDEGAEVPDGEVYWTRRLRDGSVVRVDIAPNPAAPIAPLTTR